ncbi:hypothetical protein [Amycolatopsis sp. H20-H5]|uniref:hypothetical protein n=1 Tax=Amycolatopsis sp. H20-H5 TaxID=3046309 RepID=UPI002DB7DCFF|nr:hypothetical protein [Amycolatopsis sp. H20-H5]MEC3976325.1 hypothetical protein [Amycolatopsis sp. H20-H5]
MTDFVLPVQRRYFTVMPDEVLKTPPRLLVCWDRETGWGHVAAELSDGARPAFLAFHRFSGGDWQTVCAPFVAAGYMVLAEYDRDDGLLEVRLELTARVAN